MPRGHRARATNEPKPMDMDEAVAAELEAAAEEEVEPEETITIRAADFYALQESLVGIQFELVDM